MDRYQQYPPEVRETARERDRIMRILAEHRPAPRVFMEKATGKVTIEHPELTDAEKTLVKMVRDFSEIINTKAAEAARRHREHKDTPDDRPA